MIDLSLFKESDKRKSDYLGTTMITIFMGILLILTVVFGMWLSSMGRPINSPLFDVRKFVTKGLVIFGFLDFDIY